MRKLTGALAGLALMPFCAAQAVTVGIAFPTQNDFRWYVEGFLLQDMLQKQGYTAELYFGGDYDISLQQRQIAKMAGQKVDALVIAALDGGALAEPLKAAKKNNIPVISYDRLITGTPDVDYYATFDNSSAGRMMGQFIIDELDLNNAAPDNPKHLEIFYGSLDDNNSKFFYNASMELLQPYLDSGALVVLSGEITPQQTETKGWSTQLAQKRMETLISSQKYGPNGTRLDGILSPADCVTDGIVTALKQAGYSNQNMPAVSGQDAAPEAVKRIADGMNTMTIAKPAEVLCENVVKMITAILGKKEVPVNDTSTYDNGSKTVSSLLADPVEVNKSNYREFMK